MPKEKTQSDAPAKKLTALQENFCQEYIKDFKATPAALRAKYKERSAHAIGWENLRKPEIKARIEELLKEKTLSASETIKSISDIARANIADYFTIRHAVHRPKVSITLSAYIERRYDAIEREKYIHDQALKAGLLGNDDQLQENKVAHKNLINNIRYEIIQLEFRLAQEPDATVIVDGPEELVEIADLDIARLVKDKEAGRIKSFSNTEHGPKVEMYPADAALNTVAKYHGLLRIKSFSNTEHGPKVEMYPADAALNTVAKYHGLLKEQVEHSGGLNVKTDMEIDYSKVPTAALEAIMAARVKTNE